MEINNLTPEMLANQVIPNPDAPACAIYFENHDFGGYITSIENFTNINFGTVRTTLINNKPYFCALDICRGLFVGVNHVSSMVKEAVDDIATSIDPTAIDPHFMDELYFYINIEVTHPGLYGSVAKQMVRTLFVSEPILYMFMFKSRKKEAIKFKAWLAVEILPNLRALGRNKMMELISNELATIRTITENISKNYSNAVSKQDLAIAISGLQGLLYNLFNQNNLNTSALNMAFNEIFYKLDSISNDEINGMEVIYDTNRKINDIIIGLDTIMGNNPNPMDSAMSTMGLFTYPF